LPQRQTREGFHSVVFCSCDFGAIHDQSKTLGDQLGTLKVVLPGELVSALKQSAFDTDGDDFGPLADGGAADLAALSGATVKSALRGR